MFLFLNFQHEYKFTKALFACMKSFALEVLKMIRCNGNEF